MLEPLRSCLKRCGKNRGSSTPKNPLLLPTLSSITSAATPTAWRFPMIEFSQPITEKSPSVTAIGKHHNQRKSMRLQTEEFIRRFLLHVIPKGFMRVRHFGFLANNVKERLSKCRQLLGLLPALPKPPQRSTHEMMLALTGIDLTRCPRCRKGTLIFRAQVPIPPPQDSS